MVNTVVNLQDGAKSSTKLSVLPRTEFAMADSLHLHLLIHSSAPRNDTDQRRHVEEEILVYET